MPVLRVVQAQRESNLAMPPVITCQNPLSGVGFGMLVTAGTVAGYIQRPRLSSGYRFESQVVVDTLVVAEGDTRLHPEVAAVDIPAVEVHRRTGVRQWLVQLPGVVPGNIVQVPALPAGHILDRYLRPHQVARPTPPVPVAVAYRRTGHLP